MPLWINIDFCLMLSVLKLNVEWVMLIDNDPLYILIRALSLLPPGGTLVVRGGCCEGVSSIVNSRIAWSRRGVWGFPRAKFYRNSTGYSRVITYYCYAYTVTVLFLFICLFRDWAESPTGWPTTALQYFTFPILCLNTF